MSSAYPHVCKLTVEWYCCKCAVRCIVSLWSIFTIILHSLQTAYRAMVAWWHPSKTAGFQNLRPDQCSRLLYV